MRVVAKKWNEEYGNSTIVHIDTVCPDPKCQAIVEMELNQKRDKLIALQHKTAERSKNAKRERKTKMIS